MQFCLFIYGCAGSFVAVHGLSLVAASWQLLFLAVCELLLVMASLAAERGLQTHGLQ